MANTPITGLPVLAGDDVALNTDLVTAVDVSAAPGSKNVQIAINQFFLARDLQASFYNVLDYGLVNDGVTDNSAALQTLIDMVGLVSGGTIFFPKGIYIISGALQDPTYINAQIMLPTRADWNDQQYSIKFKGCQFPPFGLATDFVVLDWIGAGSVLKSTLATGGGSEPAMFSARGEFGQPFDVDAITVEFEDLTIQTVANPMISALNFKYVNDLNLRNVVVIAGDFGSAPEVTEPTTASSYGIIMPSVNKSLGNFWSGYVGILGFYTGMRMGELAHIQNLCIGICKRAIEFGFSYHSALIERILMIWCNIGAIWTDVNPVIIQQWDNEHTLPTETAWYASTYDVYDAGNNAFGELVWITIRSAFGRVSEFRVFGAANLLMRELGVATSTGEAPHFSSAEIGLVSASILVCTFDVEIKSADYEGGFAVEVNATPATISSGARDVSNLAQINFTLSAPVISTDVVTISYVALDGFITNEGGTALGDFTDEAVTNHVGSSVLLMDTFTDVDTTSILAHTMDVGAGWTAFPSNPVGSQTVIAANKALNPAVASGAFIYHAESGAADVEVTLTGTLQNTGDFIAAIARLAAGGFINLVVTGGSVNNLQLTKNIAGTPTVLATGSITIAAGFPFTLRLNVQGTAIEGQCGATTINAVDSFNSTETKAGFFMYTVSALGTTIDDFEVVAA